MFGSFRLATTRFVLLPTSLLSLVFYFETDYYAPRIEIGQSEQASDHPIDTSVPYVQGCNVLAAPFLYVLPSQLEAWACFTRFIETQAPRYIRPTLAGVHDGLQVELKTLLLRVRDFVN